jgi:ADP-ribose pyrophosphatase YjhB (NUDIX family)
MDPRAARRGLAAAAGQPSPIRPPAAAAAGAAVSRTDREDPDLPERTGWPERLHLRLGRILVGAVNLVRPRVTLGVRLIAFDHGGRIFLLRHSYLPGWHLPGGGVAPGETCREACLREAAEEGGLALDEAPRLLGIYLNRALAARDHVAVFVAHGVRQERVPASLEVRESGFFAPDDLPESTTPAVRARLGDLEAGGQRSDDW